MTEPIQSRKGKTLLKGHTPMRISRKIQVERYEVRPEIANLASRRCAPLVQQFCAMASHGQFDLEALARSCYLQGLHDGQSAQQHKEDIRKQQGGQQ